MIYSLMLWEKYQIELPEIEVLDITLSMAVGLLEKSLNLLEPLNLQQGITLDEL